MSDTAEIIYLVEDSWEGENCMVWCDTPAPSPDMMPEDAIKYIRADLYDAQAKEIELLNKHISEHQAEYARVCSAMKSAQECLRNGNTVLASEHLTAGLAVYRKEAQSDE